MVARNQTIAENGAEKTASIVVEDLEKVIELQSMVTIVRSLLQ